MSNYEVMQDILASSYTLLAWFVCVLVCMFLSVPAHVCSVHLFMCLWMSEISLWCCSSDAFYHAFFETGYLTVLELTRLLS